MLSSDLIAQWPSMLVPPSHLTHGTPWLSGARVITFVNERQAENPKGSSSSRAALLDEVRRWALRGSSS